jgi:hypothetical protein
MRTLAYILAGIVSVGLVIYTVLVMYSVRLPELMDGDPPPTDRPARP